MIEKEVRVRFAPSPTGHMHLGSARTALYDYLFARKTGGKFILRIEDTDRKRYVEGAEKELIDGMHWLGIEWDEGPDKGGEYGPYRQSERKEIYLQYGKELIERGSAYYCFCSQEKLEKVRQQKNAGKGFSHYDGTCRILNPKEAKARVENGEPHVVRFKSPQSGSTTITDLIRGKITIDNRNLDDFILIKSDGWALYHLAATVDDHLMKISHVIRGSEWLSTFPLHALIHRAYGWQEPVWVHLSVFLKPSGKGKMSKRDAAELINDGYSIFIKDFQDLGYIPEGVINWIALMGWSYDDRTEYFSMDDLINKFSLERLNPSPAAINFTKLDYFNKEHIKGLRAEDLAERMLPFFVKNNLHPKKEDLIKLAPILNERLTTLDDAIGISRFFFQEEIQYDPLRLCISDLTIENTIHIAEEIISEIEQLPGLSKRITENSMQQFVEKKNLSPKQVYTFLREAVSGQQVTPPLFESMEILGKNKVLTRIINAIEFLKTSP
jgi:glutamyl-tRNA synthetase